MRKRRNREIHACGLLRTVPYKTMVYKSDRAREQASSLDVTTRGSLKDALARFAGNSVTSMRVIQRLQSTDPSGLACAALELLVSAEEKSPGFQYLAGLPTVSSALADLLMNQRVLSLDAAIAVALKLTAFEPRLDVLLVRRVLASAGGDLNAVTSAEALRVLGLVDAISDCLLLGSNLIRFLNHPSDKVRSKAALMLGRSNWNLTRIESLMASDDHRLRANAVESLWGHRHADVRNILWGATLDPCGRVVVNALLGLCQVGDRKAYSRLGELAETSDPVLRSGAAWAMGEIGDPEFAELLEKLALDSDAKVRTMAGKSQTKLRTPDPVVLPQPAETPVAESDPAEESSTSRQEEKRSWLSGTGRAGT
jgi:HEAT repeat protein